LFGDFFGQGKPNQAYEDIIPAMENQGNGVLGNFTCDIVVEVIMKGCVN